MPTELLVLAEIHVFHEYIYIFMCVCVRIDRKCIFLVSLFSMYIIINRVCKIT